MRKFLSASVLICLMLVFISTGCKEKSAEDCAASALSLATDFTNAGNTEAACEAWKDAYAQFLRDCDNFLTNVTQQQYEQWIASIDCTTL